MTLITFSEANKKTTLKTKDELILANGSLLQQQQKKGGEFFKKRKILTY